MFFFHIHHRKENEHGKPLDPVQTSQRALATNTKKKRHRVGWTSHEASLFHPWRVPHPTPGTPGVHGLGVALRQGTWDGIYRRWILPTMGKNGHPSPISATRMGQKTQHVRDSSQKLIWNQDLTSNIIWLVVGTPTSLLKMMEWKSVGMIIPLPSAAGKSKNSMVPVTTNQL